MSPSSRPPVAALSLGCAGLLPFFAAALAVLLGDPVWAAAGREALLLYGAVILSFMGGCRWGFAAAGLGDGPSFAALGLSVLPALFGFFVLLVHGAAPGVVGFSAAALLLAAGFVALFFVDRASTRAGGAPAWWTALRAPLSAGACLSLVGGAVS